MSSVEQLDGYANAIHEWLAQVMRDGDDRDDAEPIFGVFIVSVAGDDPFGCLATAGGVSGSKISSCCPMADVRLHEEAAQQVFASFIRTAEARSGRSLRWEERRSLALAMSGAVQAFAYRMDQHDQTFRIRRYPPQHPGSEA